MYQGLIIMNNELVQVSDFVSVLEIILLLIVSYIGTIIHEYIFIPGKTKFVKNIRVWLTVIMNFIICYSINPYIVDFNPRLILLPPLILGLLGNELALRLGTIKGSTSFIEYILGFFGIKNKLNKEERESLGINEHREVPTPIIKKDEEIKEEEPKDKQISLIKEGKSTKTPEKNLDTTEEIQMFNSYIEDESEISTKNTTILSSNINEDKTNEISQTAYILLNDIDSILLEYYDEADKNVFIEKYLNIKPRIKQFSKDFKKYEYLPVSTTLKISEIIDKERDMDIIYRKSVQISTDKENIDKTYD